MNKTLLYVRTWGMAMGRNYGKAKALALLLLLSSAPFGAYPFDANLSGASTSTQQTKSKPISGIVVDKAGAPLIGVNVVEGPTNGTTTDVDGKFTLSASPSSVLQVSYLGYVSQEIPVGTQTSFKVILEEDSKTLDEVVVVGYGAQKKVSVTGAVASIQTKELKQSSAANLSSALAGRLPGLTAMQSSGQPGRDAVTLYLRGAGTTNGASPLILIDGIPRDNISSLDPNEVASVSILKDASATAVFGVRGANGVILITTRRGVVGKTELSVSADFSMQSFIARADRLHSWEFAELRNQSQRNSGTAEENLSFTPYMIGKYKDGSDRVFYPDRDAYSAMFREWAPQTRVNVNLTGGTEKLQYFVNVGYLNQGGQFKVEPKSSLGYDPSFKMDRYSFTTNLDYQIAKGLKASLNIRSNIEKMNTPGGALYQGDMNHMVTDMIHMTWATPPTDPGPLTQEGYGVPAGQVLVQSGAADGSGYGNLNRRGYRTETSTNLNASFGLDWDLSFLTKGLSTKFLVAYDTDAEIVLNADRGFDVYNFAVAKSEATAETTGYSPRKTGENDAIRLSRAQYSKFYMNLQYSINYARSFGKHDVSAMALVQRDNWQFKDDIRQTGGRLILPYNMLGVSGRATYAFDQRYLAEVNVGYNGSEQFSPEKRFGFFPAVSAGWVISNEDFLKNNKTLTNLKLRASYGKVGNDKLGNERFLYLSDIKMEGGLMSNLGKGNQIIQGKLGNPNISWEIAYKQNYGVDLQLFGDLSLSFDFFKEKRESVLIPPGTVPEIQGVPLGNLPKVNIGEIENQGFELELTYNKAITKDLSIMVKGNYAYNKNQQMFMDEAMYPDDYAYRYRQTGFSIGQNFGYLIDYSNGNGYINTQEELDALPTYQIGSPRIGDFKYVDLNDDGFINDKDKAPIGYSNVPRVNYGASLSINYKWFDFSVLFQGIAQASRYYQGQGVFEYSLVGFYSGYHRTAWTKERFENGEKITYPALGTSQGVSQEPNSFFIMDRSFLRLKTMEVGYTLPERTLKTIGINKLRVYVSGENLFTWGNLLVDTIDPEQDQALTYPMTKRFNVGINITF